MDIVVNRDWCLLYNLDNKVLSNLWVSLGRLYRVKVTLLHISIVQGHLQCWFSFYLHSSKSLYVCMYYNRNIIHYM